MLPRFKIEYEDHNVKEIMKSLGVIKAFSGDAEFDRMTSNPVGLKIGRIIHKTFVECNEKGTEAAAATAVVMKKRCRIPSPQMSAFVMRVDHPFLFIIKGPQNVNLFIGKIGSV